MTGDNEETAEERRKRWGICIRQVAIQLENTNKKYKKILWTIITTAPVIVQAGPVLIFFVVKFSKDDVIFIVFPYILILIALQSKKISLSKIGYIRK